MGRASRKRERISPSRLMHCPAFLPRRLPHPLPACSPEHLVSRFYRFSVLCSLLTGSLFHAAGVDPHIRGFPHPHIPPFPHLWLLSPILCSLLSAAQAALSVQGFTSSLFLREAKAPICGLPPRHQAGPPFVVTHIATSVVNNIRGFPHSPFRGFTHNHICGYSLHHLCSLPHTPVTTSPPLWFPSFPLLLFPPKTHSLLTTYGDFHNTTFGGNHIFLTAFLFPL